ncbi:MAG: hypothetical protein ACKOFX_02925, partial [Solirubrobacterales bacterium]
FAAEFARTGTVFTDFKPETVFLNWLYPFNSELFHAVGMSLTGRDFLSVLINYGWLALGLLAAWVAGRPWGRSHLTVAAASLVFAAHMLVVREPGTAKNDIVAVSLALVAVAVLLGSAGGGSGRGRIATGGPLVVAGLALGMAAGTRATVLPLAVLIGVAAIVASPAGAKVRSTVVLLVSGLLTGGLWYLRNLFQTGEGDPDRMEELGVERVEPVEEDRLGLEVGKDRAGAGELGGEREVVPDRIEVPDSEVERERTETAPLGEREKGKEDGHDPRPERNGDTGRWPLARSLRDHRPEPEEEGDRQAEDHQGPGLEEADHPE